MQPTTRAGRTSRVEIQLHRLQPTRSMPRGYRARSLETPSSRSVPSPERRVFLAELGLPGGNVCLLGAFASMPLRTCTHSTHCQVAAAVACAPKSLMCHQNFPRTAFSAKNCPKTTYRYIRYVSYTKHERASRDTPDAFGTARYGMGNGLSAAGGKKKRVFPRDGMGKGFRLFTTGWEWDGKVGSHLVDGTGRDYTISWWDRTGRDRETRR